MDDEPRALFHESRPDGDKIRQVEIVARQPNDSAFRREL
jgi:hypothetical protein